MARKRSKEFVDLDSTKDSYGVGLEDMSVSMSNNESNGFDYSEASDLESIQVAAYKEVLKNYNELKVLKRKLAKTISLEVMYLDFVDFGVRQVSYSILRIGVWKDGMIHTYADFDMKSPGCYGYHPLRDVSHTCYSKDLRFLYNPLSLSMDPHFTKKLDEFSGCKLPDSLKENICKLIQSYCFNCGVSVNLVVNYISSMPDAMKSIFCKLLKHAFAIDCRTEKLVLDLIKLIANACEDNGFGSNPGNGSSSQDTNIHGDDEELHTSGSCRNQNLGNKDVHNDVPCSQYEVYKAKNSSNPIPHLNLGLKNYSPSGTSDSARDGYPYSTSLPVPKLPRSSSKFTPANVANDDIDRLLPIYLQVSKLYQNLSHHQLGSLPIEVPYKENLSPSFSQKVYSILFQRLFCLSFTFVFSFHSYSYFILYQFFFQTPIVMQTLDFTPYTTQRNFFDASKSLMNSSSRFNSQSLADSVRALSKKSDDMYNLKLKKSGLRLSTPQAMCPSSSRPTDENPSQSFAYRSRDSSAGGKLPIRALDVLQNQEHLMKDVDEADQDLLARAFRRSSKAHPLNQSNMGCSFLEISSAHSHFRNSLEFHWDKYVRLDMVFEDYEFVYPVVPEQPLDNTFWSFSTNIFKLHMVFIIVFSIFGNTDSGIYTMMFLEHWLSPRTSLTSVFSHSDIPKIRIKIANDLVFQPKNSGNKNRVVNFNLQVSVLLISSCSFFVYYILFFISFHTLLQFILQEE
ncbi:hypothetical protein C2845_PM09G07380 [Panicum miliaceum]|uniref:Uncharacterized protein n=1 Tax=Panicum miliaceum TaxID=4540 RepID=A0A3L6RWB4_PANMI|nr:hypothetical protein C2845_PM09G07380 [Panicum miliaceum]